MKELLRLLKVHLSSPERVALWDALEAFHCEQHDLKNRGDIHRVEEADRLLEIFNGRTLLL